MSGIDINASTDIGRHISTVLRTLTTIGSDLDDPQTYRYEREREEINTYIISPPSVSPPSPPKPAVQSPVHIRPAHKRAQSFAGKSFLDEKAALRAMEVDLAKQTRKLQRLR